MPHLLQTINSPADLRALPRQQLPALADELRSYLIAKRGENRRSLEL
jgi:1-deoxy-D-xylulose-5-phosphate synthase